MDKKMYEEKIQWYKDKLLKHTLQEDGTYVPKHILNTKSEFSKTIKENLRNQRKYGSQREIFQTSGKIQEILVQNFNYACSYLIKQLNGYNLGSVKEKISDKANEMIQICDSYDIIIKSHHYFNLKIEQAELENDYIFCYFLGANSKHRKVAEELSKKTGIPLYDMPHIDEFVPYDLQFNAEHLYDIDSEQFVNLIRYAKYICTDSFHCTVFSILHHKQFLAFDRYSDPLMMSRNSRIANLCDITGLSSRRYTGDVLEQMKKPIDYDRVDERLEKEKAISVAYIREALGKND